MRKTKIITLIAGNMLLSLANLPADVPSLINYQGLLLDQTGNPFQGNKNIEVRVYDGPVGGNILYQETMGIVTFSNGVCSFRFGNAGSGISASLLSASQYLAIVVDGVEQSPRAQLVAVPYALKSSDAQGLISGSIALPPGSVGSSQLAPNSVQAGHLAAGILTPHKVVSSNITATPNESYLLDPSSSGSIQLPSNPQIGDVVKIQGDGAKVKVQSAHAIKKWTYREIPQFESDVENITFSKNLDKIFLKTMEAVYLSVDSGKSWNILQTPNSATQSFAFDCSEDGSILLIKEDDLNPWYISKNGGVSWNILILPSEIAGIDSLLKLSPDGTRIFIFADTGTYVTSDSGAIWSKSNLPQGYGIGMGYIKMSQDGRVIILTASNSNTGYEIIISNNFGQSWLTGNQLALPANLIFDEKPPYAISSDGQKIVLFDAENGNRYFSQDYGANWSISKYKITTLSDSQDTPDTPLITGVNGFQNGKTLFTSNLISYDQGITWNAVKFPNSNRYIKTGESTIGPEDQISLIDSSSDFLRFIGKVEDNGESGFFTSWDDELTLENGQRIDFCYLGNGIWSAVEAPAIQ